MSELTSRVLAGLLVASLATPTGPGAGPPAAVAVPAAPGAPEPAAAPTPDLPPGASGDWWSQVQADIRKSEYSVTWQEKTLLPQGRPAYQAPNRAQNLRTYFSGDGVRVVARTTDLPPSQGAAHAGSGAATGTGRRGPAACAPATSVAALTYAPTASSRGGRRPDDPRPGVQRRKS